MDRMKRERTRRSLNIVTSARHGASHMPGAGRRRTRPRRTPCLPRASAAGSIPGNGGGSWRWRSGGPGSSCLRTPFGWLRQARGVSWRCHSCLRPASDAGCRSRGRPCPTSRVCAGRAGWPRGLSRYAPGGMRAPGQALRLERTTRAVVPVGAIPSTRFRTVPRGQSLQCRASDHIGTGIELEPLGRKALRSLAAGGPKRRNDGFDLAVFKGGANPAHTIDRVRRDPVGRTIWRRWSGCRRRSRVEI